MTGENEFVLNDETMKQALQEYFIKRVFDPSQIVTVKSIEPENVGTPYAKAWKYSVMVECIIEPTTTEAK